MVQWLHPVEGTVLAGEPVMAGTRDVFTSPLLELGTAPKPRQVLDGESLVRLFRDPAAQLQRDAIFQHSPGYLGAGADSWRTTPVSLIQTGDWKLMEFLEDGRLELYNLRDDIGERTNLAQEMPEKVKKLHARLIAWRTEVKAPMPTRNDGGAAVIVGEPTAGMLFGKDLEPRPDGRALMIRTAPLILSPSGENYVPGGVPPAIPVPDGRKGHDTIFERALGEALEPGGS
jgi:hypothetical protein